MKFKLSNLSNLQQRVLIGLPGAAFIVWGICYSGWIYFSLFFLICSLSLIEYYGLIRANGYNPQSQIGIIAGVLLFILTFLVEIRILPPSYYYAIFPLVATISIIVLYRTTENRPFINISLTILGIIYVALPFALLNLSVIKNGEYQYPITLGILLLQWASDTGAYFAGKLFGKRKLFERVSPKKTWEGSIGGGLLAILVSIGLAYFFPILAPWQWFAITAIIIVAGTYGDLIESLLKRSIEIKDSGSLLLGHGGFLDRFDSLLIAVPFIAAFLRIFI